MGGLLYSNRRLPRLPSKGLSLILKTFSEESIKKKVAKSKWRSEQAHNVGSEDRNYLFVFQQWKVIILKYYFPLRSKDVNCFTQDT